MIEGKSVIVTGWGLTSCSGSSSDILKEAHLKVLNKEQCEKQFNARDFFDHTMYCAYGGIQDVCQVTILFNMS